MADRTARNVASILYFQLGKDTLNKLYNSMRREVYGIPGDSVPLRDILHELSDIMGTEDPASAQ
jgi:hypothetical protein